MASPSRTNKRRSTPELKEQPLLEATDPHFSTSPFLRLLVGVMGPRDGELVPWDGVGWGLGQSLCVGASGGWGATLGSPQILTEPRMTVLDGPLEVIQPSGSQNAPLHALGSL